MKIFANGHNSSLSRASAGFPVVLAALLIVALAPASYAQNFPVTMSPKVTPPAAPAVFVTGATTGQGGTTAPAQVAPTVSVLNAASVPGALNSISRNASMDKILHVTLGHSVFIDTKTRLRRVYVSDPAVVNSVTLNPNQIIVTGMSPGTCSLTLLDEAGLAQSYVVSSDIDIAGLRLAMSAAMRSDAVKIDGSGGRVTLSGIVGSDAMSDTAAKLAGLYSKEVANALVVVPNRAKQVRLQVRILEVDRSKALQLGINLFSPGGNSNYLASSTSSQYPTASVLSQSASAGALGTLATSNPLSFLLYSAKLNLGTTIQDLQTKQVLQILAEPTITTISGQKADFLSGGEFPFPVVQPGSGAGSAPVVSIQFRAFGVKVEFTPFVNEDGTIRLKVAPEVSALDYSNAIQISGVTIPALSTRRATTEVELRSEQSFAISGLLDQRTTDLMSKNPGAANIPILGNLFKSKNANHSTTELVVVVTPTVVDPLGEMAVPNQPDLPIQRLDIPQFDKSLGKNHDTDPAAPPLTPDHPPVAPPVFPYVTPPAPRPTRAEENASPAPTTERTPAPSSINPATGTVAAPATKIDPALLPFVSSNSPAKSSRKPETGSISVAGAGAKVTLTSMVEVMALSHESDADVMVAALRRRGYNVGVTHTPQDSLVHLDVGPFAEPGDAEAMRQRLINDGYNAMLK